MNKFVLFIVSIMMFFSTIKVVHAQIDVKNYWQCTANDQINPVWLGQAATQQDAINMAWRTCKQNSNNSEVCEVARENCQQVINGKIYKPAWRCIAFDDNARHFSGEKQHSRKGAVTSAMSQCKKVSFAPKTCIVQLITCKDV